MPEQTDTAPNPDKTIPFRPSKDNGEVDKTVPFKAYKSKEDIERIVRTGKILTHFQLEKKLGEGGMGTVYLATDVTLDRPTAIKFLNHTVIRQSLKMNSNLSEGERKATVDAIEARFKREAKSAASINHPNLAQIYEANFDTDDWYIAMEYVKGDSLAGLLEKEKTFAIGQILNIFKQTVLGLKHAWDNYKIVHRDIKPANIMVTPEGVVKIVDLGLAKPVDGAKDLPEVTSESIAIGTPQYMAPEQARGEDVTYHADVFALGATLYELCVGKKAFNGNTPASVYHCQTKKDYKPIQDLRPDTPRPLARLIESMMDPKTGARPTNYDALLKEIKMIEGDNHSSITTLVGLVTKEVRRLRSVDYNRLLPWKAFLDREYWANPMLYTLIGLGLIPVFLLKESPRPNRSAWLLIAAAASLWGILFHVYLRPPKSRHLALLKTIGLTVVGTVPFIVILSRFDSLEKLLGADFNKTNELSVWKLIVVAALIEEAAKLIAVWLLPKFLRSEPTQKDYVVTGVACGLAFSLKAGIVYSIISWDQIFLSYPDTTVSRILLLLMVVPLLHACWGAISARFIFLAREHAKVQVGFIIVGLVLVSLLHGLWLAFPRNQWRLLIAATSVLLLLASTHREEPEAQTA